MRIKPRIAIAPTKTDVSGLATKQELADSTKEVAAVKDLLATNTLSDETREDLVLALEDKISGEVQAIADLKQRVSECEADGATAEVIFGELQEKGYLTEA